MGDFELEENDFTDSCGEDWEELHDQRESVTEAFSWFRSREDGRSRSDDTCSLRMETMPLYHGAQLTYAESMVLIMAFILSHHLTSSAVVDLLTLISLHTQWGSIFCASKYIFDKFFSLRNLTFPVTRHYFCRACFAKIASNDKNCKTCKSDLSTAKATFYFLEMSMVSQLQAMFKRFEVTTPNAGSFRCKAYLLGSTCDLQAKALVMHMVAHNGYYGCAKCLQRGTHEHHRHQYPHDAGPPRSHSQTQAHAAEAHAQKATVFGIKGPSWLNWVPKFDLIKGNSIDYMHGTLLGVTKALMMLWFGSANKNAPYYCGHHLCDIDNILLAIRPPMDIHRTPRGIDDHLRHWKASEYRSWLLFYSLPIMHLFLPNDYFQNYLLLVNAIHILLGEVISQDEINKAEDLLQQFVEGFKMLYGSKLVSLNVHNLCHYAQTVRELGPLWCHSCFSFEDVNGQLLKLIHGTQGVEEQVLRAVAILQKFSEVGDACFIPGTASKKLYDSLNNVTVPPEERSNFTEIGPGFYSVGSLKEESCKADGTYSTIKPSHMEAVMARLDFLPESLMIYQRMMKNGEMVHSRLYSRAVRHNSYTIEYTTDENSCFGEVLYFIQVTTRTCGCGIAKRACECNSVTARHFALVQCFERLVPTPADSENATALFSVPHVSRCRMSQGYKAVKLNEMVGKVVSMCINGNTYLATFPNRFEKD
ncbi:PREDICTED: uncharacterized protein LOC109480858 [Branchiostoma belcheri]|uniref:Uncharacterized protein LOC109480858 n=1 Tax=Branchiostoma belcheri TaxID=7741 RepID=A0A6P5AAG2_BRABE|nr:PREDICTED: uncharacterized protein LOC109480858 [Branchiostoma belcheri]